MIQLKENTWYKTTQGDRAFVVFKNPNHQQEDMNNYCFSGYVENNCDIMNWTSKGCNANCYDLIEEIPNPNPNPVSEKTEKTLQEEKDVRVLIKNASHYAYTIDAVFHWLSGFSRSNNLGSITNHHYTLNDISCALKNIKHLKDTEL